ncbi:MAG: hypothetical protein R3F34_08360 [Planctomycetota bacterium]
MIPIISTLPLLLPVSALAAPPTPALVATTCVADAVDDLIAEGREALDRGELEAAEQKFAEAEAKDADRGAIWRMRASISRGAIDDVLAELGTLRRAGKKGPDYDYLYGLCFATQAAFEIAQGGGSNTGLVLQDAKRELEGVTSKDPVRYRDAHLYLARVCRDLGDDAGTEAAARKAIEHYPASIEAHELVARGALGRYAALSQDEEKADEAKAAYEAATGAVERAIELVGAPRGGGEQAQLATLQALRGDVLAFGKDLDGAMHAYAEAIGWEPAGFDYRRAYATLDIDRLVKCIDEGRALFTKRARGKDPRMATVDWWLGYAIMQSKDPARNEDGEKAMLRAIELWPGYTNSWYYVARLRIDRKDPAGAVEALHQMSELDRAGLIGLVQWDPNDITRLFGLIDHSMNQKTPDNLEAAFLARIQAEAFPDRDDYWNNVGLFLRDAADLRGGRKGRKKFSEKEREELLPLYEQSLEAYRKALELVPDSPMYLNDTAVLLHYYLERDYDQALAMYAEAEKQAQAQLDSGKLSKDVRPLVEIALRDSRNNRRALEEKIAQEKRGEEGGGEKKKGGGGR